MTHYNMVPRILRLLYCVQTATSRGNSNLNQNTRNYFEKKNVWIDCNGLKKLNVKLRKTKCLWIRKKTIVNRIMIRTLISCSTLQFFFSIILVRLLTLQIIILTVTCIYRINPSMHNFCVMLRLHVQYC